MHPLSGKKQTEEHIKKRMAAGAGRPANTPDVLWSKVDIRGENECWPWIGYINHNGYGRTWISNKGYYAHRVIFNLANPGLIQLSAPKNASDHGMLLHSCDNPCCCNPNHLRIGNHADNMNDKKTRGRSKIFTSTTSPNSMLSESDVRDIRWLSSLGLSSGEISKVYGMSKAPIKAILVGRTYKDVL